MLPGLRLKATYSGSEEGTYVSIRLTNSWKMRKDLACGQKNIWCKDQCVGKKLSFLVLITKKVFRNLCWTSCTSMYMYITSHLSWITCVLVMLNYLPWFLATVQKIRASIYPYLKHAGSWFISFWHTMMENHYQLKMLHWTYLQDGFAVVAPRC